MKRARDSGGQTPALFLNAVPAGGHDGLAAIAALIDGDDDDDQMRSDRSSGDDVATPASCQRRARKRSRSAGIGHVQVRLALSALESQPSGSPEHAARGELDALDAHTNGQARTHSPMQCTSSGIRGGVSPAPHEGLPSSGGSSGEELPPATDDWRRSP